jgi:hypothetical protein
MPDEAMVVVDGNGFYFRTRDPDVRYCMYILESRSFYLKLTLAD